MNVSLSVIKQYLNVNKLKCNESKMKALIITNKCKYTQINIKFVDLRTNNEKIEKVSFVNYIDFQTDST